MYLDENKICFITCVNDEDKYEKSMESLKLLESPAGMQIEARAVREAPSMAAGYNRVMKDSDAKYKIYLHQDVWILKDDFLVQLVNVFRQNPKIGIMGIVGSSDVPRSAIWWDGEMIGGVLDNHTGMLQSYVYKINPKEPIQAMLLDGLILATQYDLPWRDDLFDKWHFYDLSQCMEFYRRDFMAAVLPQAAPLCVHWCGINKLIGYEEERQKFIKEYLPPPPLMRWRGLFIAKKNFQKIFSFSFNYHKCVIECNLIGK